MREAGLVGNALVPKRQVFVVVQAEILDVLNELIRRILAVSVEAGPILRSKSTGGYGLYVHVCTLKVEYVHLQGHCKVTEFARLGIELIELGTSGALAFGGRCTDDRVASCRVACDAVDGVLGDFGLQDWAAMCELKSFFANHWLVVIGFVTNCCQVWGTKSCHIGQSANISGTFWYSLPVSVLGQATLRQVSPGRWGGAWRNSFQNCGVLYTLRLLEVAGSCCLGLKSSLSPTLMLSIVEARGEAPGPAASA